MSENAEEGTNSENMRCHVEEMNAKEDETIKQILKLENEFRSHNELMLKEMKLQKEVMERMWFLTQRYIILVSTGPCCKFNEVYTTPPEDVLLNEYNEKLQTVRNSNCRLWHSLRGLRYSLLHFRDLCSQLDMTRETALITGDAFHKPLAYFIELTDDLFKYFHSLLLSFKYHAHQLDPIELLSIENYKKLLDPSEDFEEYLKYGLVYCKCLRPRPVCENKSAACRQIPKKHSKIAHLG